MDDYLEDVHACLFITYAPRLACLDQPRAKKKMQSHAGGLGVARLLDCGRDPWQASTQSYGAQK
ncbi:hypothetical protein DT23_09885 [Thioclava indica]|uniref:Uncharacterized protein n=1 Tax=Thioclava indica TaxID=1353528 RepID=A0A074JZ71_9RHOB|nr:hypothetical protein DT23_09885 [Thioclava indica]